MSYETVKYEVRVDREQLLNLFLGQGNLPLTLEDQTVTLDEINRQVSSGEGDEELHLVEVYGDSDNPNVTYVHGTGVLKAVVGSKAFTLSLELHLEDRFE